MAEIGAEPWSFGFTEVEPGVRLHYAELAPAGLTDAPLIVLLHGFPEFWYSWRHQIAPLADAGYHVVVPDLRGYNESDKPRSVDAYRIDRLAADVGALAAAFGRERITLAGHDWGGAVAWHFALRHPEQLDALVVMNAPHPAAFAKNMRRGSLPNLRQLRRSWYMFLFQVPWLPEQFLAANDYRFIENAFRGMAVHKDAFPDDVLRRFKEAAARPGALRAALNYYRAAMRTGLRGVFAGRRVRVPQIAVPTLLLWGELDSALGKELTEGMDEFFAGPLEIVYLPDCSHWVQQECPEDVNVLMGDFLARHRR